MGLHLNTSNFPSSVQVVCSFIRQFSGGYPFAAFTILDQTQSDLHQDANNEPSSWNLVIPITSFEGGGIWYEASSGTAPCPLDPSRHGHVLDVASGPQWLPAANAKHCTLPWSGRRCVVVAFTPRFLEKLDPKDVCRLHDSGFVLQKPVQTAELSEDEVPCKCVSDMMVIELGCGSAALSWACHRQGFQVMPIASRSNFDRKPKLRVHHLDLTDPEALKSLEELICTESARIALIWAAVPHGTASVARSKPLPRFERLNLPAPKPLRSLSKPEGLDGLVGRDKAKCEVANQVYHGVAVLLQAALKRGVRCVIENPVTSLYWQTESFRSLQAMHLGSVVHFHMCQHGGPRPKHVQLWTSDQNFASLAAVCPGSKLCSHEPWRPVAPDLNLPFDSSGRAEYPALLCDRVAGILKQACLAQGIVDRLSLQSAIEHSAPGTQRLVLGLQPAGAKAPQLLPEFGHHLQVVVTPSSKLPQAPQHAVFASRRLLQWGQFQAECRSPSVGIRCDLDTTVLEPSSLVEVVLFGIPASPEVFVRKAVEAGHPADFKSSLEPLLKCVVEENIVGDELKLAKARLAFVAKWSSRAKALEKREAELHASLPKHIKHILKGKRLLLLQEMIEFYGLPDTELVEHMKEGFSLSGWMPSSGSFPASTKRPEFSVDALKLLSAGFNAATLSKAKVRQEQPLEEATWQETLAEEEQGWVWRCEDQVMDGKVVARRFGIFQNGKIRVIDDLTCCGLNATVGLREKFVLHSIDKMAAMLAYATSLVNDPDFSLCGRTYDLKSAYKQFPICQRDFDLLRFMVAEPGKLEPTLFGFSSLPFGGIGSVSAFLRISLCLWQLGIKGLRVMWTAFFDDYSVVSKESLKRSAAFGIESLFQLLGLTFAKEGKKAPPFSDVFSMLGLSVNLGTFKKGSVEIGHTEKRVSELDSSLGAVIDHGSLSMKEAERLRGRMNFFEGHAFGRGPAQALRTIDHQAKTGATSKKLSASVLSAIEMLRCRLRSAIPLQISSVALSTWYLFTDGSCEAATGSGAVGAVLYDQGGRLISAFSESVPADVMSSLLQDSANPIYELELYPVLISLRKWASKLAGSQVVSFVDNDAAKYALVRSCSATKMGASIIDAIRIIEQNFQLRVWYARVPTHSNPADAPSRLDVTGLESFLVGDISWEVSSTAL